MAYKKSARKMYLTEAEWLIMECLWEESPRTGREVWEWTQERNTWGRSTALTFLRRLEDKGYVKAEKTGGRKRYTALLSREDAALIEAKDFLQRAYRGSVTLMLRCLAKKDALPKEEIDQLDALLKEWKEEEDA